jgi:hypothetical protein
MLHAPAEQAAQRPAQRDQADVDDHRGGELARREPRHREQREAAHCRKAERDGERGFERGGERQTQHREQCAASKR